ncbi:AAA family ATPase [Marinifilum flexuosum]|uniref:AAA ATPase-like protein n=1 Tax=Marinifilum flexuosum TaxID=1117708 RepID=A0A419WN29_9BACT|nr:AAA family ATPase [Marinifilum flexuosum]RKD96806.1 AAA ATPase-like protein [Marinifilum flexuosum]
MELLYVWIEDYKNIKKQGFNFSPKHWFDFKPEEDKEGNIIGGTLHHEERNTNYPKDFFGENISNVTAIVGKNGSGKSTLMEAIFKFSLGSAFETNGIPFVEIQDIPGIFKTIIIYSKNKTTKYCGFTNLDIIIKHLDIERKPLDFHLKTTKSFIPNDDLENPYEQTKKVNFIPSYLNIYPCYYSNIFDEIKIQEYKNREDIWFRTNDTIQNNSIPNTFRTDISINNRIKSFQNISDFHHSEITQQAIFINQFIQLEEDLPFSLPPYLIINLNFSVQNLKDLLERSELRMNWLKQHIHTEPYYLPNKFSDQIILFLWLKGLTETNIDDYDTKQKIQRFIKSIDLTTEIEWSDTFLEFIAILFESQEKITTFPKNNFDIIEYFIGVKEIITSGLLKKYDYNRKNGIKSFRLQDSSNINRMNYFINNAKRINFSNIFQFGFSYDKNDIFNSMSSGEKALLKFGSNMWHLISKIKENHTDIISNILTEDRIKIPDNLLIMLDEAELTLHPEWQKTFLDWSLRIIQIVCKDFDSIQVLYSSHSPFFLSDLPKENVIFLKSQKGKDVNDNSINLCHVCKRKEQPEYTFGANIHSLYRNSFFLENGLMGEFAKGKIDQVIRNLNNELQNEEDKMSPGDMLFVIQQIGEPLLKNKLQEMFDHYEFELNDEIEILEAKLAELKRNKQ